jgi:hypothetical protein
MQLGDLSTDERNQRSPLDEALDDAEQALTTMISLLEAGNLDPLSNEQTISWWQRFEAFRNKLPLVDHGLIAHGEAADLPREYCSSTMIQFLVRVLQLSHGEAAARVHAATALGARTSMLGEALEPLLPQLAALQRDGVVSTEKVQIVERAMHNLTRPTLDPAAVETAGQLLTEHAVILAPAELKRFAHAVVNAADPDGPEPIDNQLQHDRRYLELKQRRDGMWQLHGKLTRTVGAQLNAILDPLSLSPARRRSRMRTAKSSTSLMNGPTCSGYMMHSKRAAHGCSKATTSPRSAGSRHPLWSPSGSRTCWPRRDWQRQPAAPSSPLISYCGLLMKPRSGPRLLIGMVSRWR